MENKIYFDTFANTYVTEKDVYAPPERYYEISPSEDVDAYVETWATNIGLLLDIAYTDLDIENKHISSIRKSIAKEISVELLYLVEYSIPKNKYDEIYSYLFEEEQKITNYQDMKDDTSLKEVNLNRLDDFLTWEDDWNGYGAPAFDKNLIEYIRELINLIDEDIQPEVFPDQGSGFQFEWGSLVPTDFYIEMEILGNDDFNIYYELKDKKSNEDGFKIHIDKENINDFIRLIVDGSERLEKYNQVIKEINNQ